MKMGRWKRGTMVALCALAASAGGSAERPVHAAAHGSVVAVSVGRAGTWLVVSWDVSGEVNGVTIMEGTDPDHINAFVADAIDVTSIVVEGLAPAARHYFRVRGGAGSGAIAAERGVPQMGVLNFRDA